MQVSLTALEGLPLIEPSDDLASLLVETFRSNNVSLQSGDILVLAQKIVSKSEGRFRDLAAVSPTDTAEKLAVLSGKDPRHVQAILDESSEVVAHRPGVIVVEHRLGHVMANAGIDRSNVAEHKGDVVLLLPEDPDASALGIKQALDAAFTTNIGVIVADSVGRAWRLGTVGLAIGVAGLPALIDRRGDEDLFGRTLEVTVTAFADEVAAAATLAMGEGAEGRPAVLVRGLEWDGPDQTASALLRPRDEDMFR